MTMPQHYMAYRRHKLLRDSDHVENGPINWKVVHDSGSFRVSKACAEASAVPSTTNTDFKHYVGYEPQVVVAPVRSAIDGESADQESRSHPPPSDTSTAQAESRDGDSIPPAIRLTQQWIIWSSSLRGGNRLVRPPGSGMRRFAHTVFGKRAAERVYDPLIADLQHEYFEALAAGSRVQAGFVRLRGYVSFVSAVLHSLRVLALVKAAKELHKLR
jgi:hypothetical protein